MSTLNSSSTFEEIEAAYADNASYDEDGSASKCRVFITACRLLLQQSPKRARHGGRGEVELDLTLVREEMQSARQWLAANLSNAGGGVIHYDMSDFRR